MLYNACLEGKEGWLLIVNALIDKKGDFNAPSADPDKGEAHPCELLG